MTGCLSKTSTTVSNNDRNNNGYANPPGGLPGGSLTGTFIPAQSPWRLKKKRFEAGQAQVKTSCQKLKNDAEIKNVTCYPITALSFVPDAKMEQYWSWNMKKAKFESGARFSNVLIVTGGGKLLPFTFKMEVSIVLQITWRSYRLKNHSLDFGLNVWFRGRKVIGTLKKRANGLLQHCFVIFPS